MEKETSVSYDFCSTALYFGKAQERVIRRANYEAIATYCGRVPDNKIYFILGDLDRPAT